MIGRPISRIKRVVLSALSVLLLLLSYTWISHRQHQINPQDTTIPSWGQLAEGAKNLLSQIERGIAG